MPSQVCVAYYRVSTRQQARSGLGLEAQRAAVQRYVDVNQCRVLEELTDIESGRNDARPMFTRALWLCRVYGAKLVIARLDRLSRNAGLIAGLMETDVEFVAADMPLANRFTLHILAAVAESRIQAHIGTGERGARDRQGKGQKTGRSTAVRLQNVFCGRVGGQRARVEEAGDGSGARLEADALRVAGQRGDDAWDSPSADRDGLYTAERGRPLVDRDYRAYVRNPGRAAASALRPVT